MFAKSAAAAAMMVGAICVFCVSFYDGRNDRAKYEKYVVEQKQDCIKREGQVIEHLDASVWVSGFDCVFPKRISGL
jgi:hypothetical protein